MKKGRKTDMLISIIETTNLKPYYVTQIDKGELHVSISIEGILDSIREEFESNCHNGLNWVEED